MNANACAANTASPDLSELIRDDRVHSRLFTDPAIFDLEIERLFKRTWLFVAHESEVPKPGDFKALDLAREPIIVVRGKDAQIRVLMNRCRHRGSVVCQTPHGNKSRFQCWYHGWTYALDGRLISRVDETAGASRGDLGLVALPRVESYRGFIFASFSTDVPSLEEYLGAARQFIDIVVDYAPGGHLLVRPGVVQKYRYRGNWKQVGMDGYHVHFVHASVVDIFSRRRSSTGSAVGALQVEDPWSDQSTSRARGFPYGHAALDLREQRRRHGDALLEEVRKASGGIQYVERMLAEHGEQKARDLIALHGDPHLGVYPNLQLIHDHLRVIRPISVDETEVHMYPILLLDVPPEFNTHRLRHHEDFYGPASFGSPDDAEVFERTQQGLSASTAPWIMINRGIEREARDEDGTFFGRISDEVTQRAQFREWRRLMLP